MVLRPLRFVFLTTAITVVAAGDHAFLSQGASKVSTSAFGIVDRSVRNEAPCHLLSPTSSDHRYHAVAATEKQALCKPCQGNGEYDDEEDDTEAVFALVRNDGSSAQMMERARLWSTEFAVNKKRSLLHGSRSAIGELEYLESVQESKVIPCCLQRQPQHSRSTTVSSSSSSSSFLRQTIV